MLCIAVLFAVIGSSGGAVVFEPPRYVGPGNYGSGFQGFPGSQNILGHISGGMYLSSDGGKTWSKQHGVGDTSSAVFNDAQANKGSYQDISGVAHGKIDHDAQYRTFNATSLVDYRVGGSHLRAKRVHAAVTFRGLPQPATCGTAAQKYGCPFRTNGNGWVRLHDGTLLASAILYWGGSHASPNPPVRNEATSIVAYRSKDGLIWDFAGTIMDAKSVPHAEEGPNENDLVVLQDGRTVLCVARVDAGEGPHHLFSAYTKSYSRDGGFSWSRPQRMPYGLGSARPRIIRLRGGPLVLSGGRRHKDNHDVFLWVNMKGDAIHWEKYSISYWHNRFVQHPPDRFSPAINSSTAQESTSYTSLVNLECWSGLLMYDHGLHPHRKVFSIRFSIPELKSARLCAAAAPTPAPPPASREKQLATPPSPAVAGVSGAAPAPAAAAPAPATAHAIPRIAQPRCLCMVLALISLVFGLSGR